MQQADTSLGDMRLILRKYLFRAEFLVSGIILFSAMNAFANSSASHSSIITKQKNGNSSVTLRSGTTVLTDYDVDHDGLIDLREINVPGTKITIVNPGREILGMRLLVELKRKAGFVVESRLRYDSNAKSFLLEDLKQVFREDMFFDVDEGAGSAPAGTCAVREKPMAGIPAVAGKINQFAASSNDTINALVSNSCGDKKSNLVEDIGDLLGSKQAQKPRFMACLTEIGIAWDGPFRLVSLKANEVLARALIEKKEIVSCSNQIGPAKCGKVPGSEQKIIINGQCLTGQEPAQRGKQILFHEILHIAGVTDEKDARRIEHCCLDGFSSTNPNCKYGQTVVDPQTAQVVQDRMAIAKPPSKPAPPQKVATFKAPETAATTTATIESSSGTTYLSTALTQIQEDTVSAASEVAYNFGKTIDRLDGLVISRAEAKDSSSSQPRSGNARRREPASIDKRSKLESATNEMELATDRTSKLRLFEVGQDGSLLPASEDLLTNGSSAEQNAGLAANTGGSSSDLSFEDDGPSPDKQINREMAGSTEHSGAPLASGSGPSNPKLSGPSRGTSAPKLQKRSSTTGGGSLYSDRARFLFREVSQSSDRINLLRSSNFGKQLSAEGIQITTGQEKFGSLISPEITKSLDEVVGEKW